MGKPRVILFGLVWVLAVTSCTGGAGSDTSSTTSTTVAASTSTSTPRPVTTTVPGPCDDLVFCVTYEIPDDAVWSDGEPVGVDDFVHTLDLITDPVRGATEKTGYELITSIEPLGDRTVLVTFSEVFGPWRTLFPYLLPAHGELSYREEGAPVSGPFILEEWIVGERIVLRRNPSYWAGVEPVSGEPLGDVREIVFVFPASARDQLRGLEGNEIDVINPRPLDWMIEDLGVMEGVSFEVAPGEFWEHIDFNHDDPLLSQGWVREAISLAVDREAILEQTVRRVDVDAQTLDSAVYMRNSIHYQDNYDLAHNPAAAEQILVDRFCEKGDDGVYSCQGRRLAFSWATTVGDEYRDVIFDVVSESLEQIGVEVVLQPRTPSELFSTDVFFGGPEVWQIINFSWKGEADPFLANSTYSCRGDAPSGFGDLNVNRYCSEQVETLIESTSLLSDTEERAAGYNAADAAYLGDRAIIPLFQKPALLAFDSALSGPITNISKSGNLWNVGAWRGLDTVIIALEAEPDDLDPINPGSDSARMVLSAMLHGAFGINSSLEFIPVLAGEAAAHQGVNAG